jgi:hypothetical protein
MESSQQYKKKWQATQISNWPFLILLLSICDTREIVESHYDFFAGVGLFCLILIFLQTSPGLLLIFS